MLTKIPELIEIAQSKPIPPHIHYDRKININANYVNYATSALLAMIEQNDTNESFGIEGHGEGWYGSKLLSPILDYCKDDIDNFTVSRTDILSKSGLSKKRLDAIFLSTAGVEIAGFGSVEVACTEDVLRPGKRHYDLEKLWDAMPTMSTALLAHVDNDPETSMLLQVVGVQQIGDYTCTFRLLLS